MAIFTLNSYFNAVNTAWRIKSGERLSEYLSCRHNHVTNAHLHLSNPEDECSGFFDCPQDEIVGAHLRCIKELKMNDFTAAFDSQLIVVQSVSKAFQGLKDENWLLPVLNTVMLDLRLIAIRLTSQPRDQASAAKPLESTAESLMAAFRICTADNRTAEHGTKKWGMMSLVNQLFKVYFRINKLHLMKPLIRAIDSSPLKERFALSQQITYRYFTGRMAMFYSDFATANDSLTYAFVRCHKQSKKNKRLILLNLVPVKILLGYMPTKALLEKYDLMQLWSIVLAVKRGCISDLSKAMHEYQTFFIECGIYLIIEKLKIITYRNLFKKVYLSLKTHQLAINDLLVALQLMEGQEVDLEMTHCILANLINEGKVKGYISIQHQKLVLSKMDPFPKLSTIN